MFFTRTSSSSRRFSHGDDDECEYEDDFGNLLQNTKKKQRQKIRHRVIISSSSRADEEEVECRVGALDNGGPRRRLDGDGIASDVFTPQLRTDTRDTDGNVVQRTRGDDASPRR